MSKLEDFLGLSDVSEIRNEIDVNVNGKKLSLVIRPITEKEHTDFQKRCTTNKGNKVIFDSGKYSNLVLSNCIVEPNFNDADFLEKVKCVDSVDFLNRKFPSGTIISIAQQIQKLSGFDDYEMEIEQAKN